MRRLLPALLPLAAALVALLVWSLLAMRLPAVLLPAPLDVALAIAARRADLWAATIYTAQASLFGLALALGAGMSLAVLFRRSRWLMLALTPYALLLQTLPIVAVAPLLLVWLGYGTPVATVTAALAAFFPVLAAAHAGLGAATQSQIELLRLYGATWTQELVLLRLPGALPSIMTGLRTAGGLAVIGAIVGEFVASNGLPPSLGYLVLRSARAADPAMSFAAIGAASGLALAIYGAVVLVERQLIGRWAGKS
jgi:NitT/TauT family transport system permease protein